MFRVFDMLLSIHCKNDTMSIGILRQYRLCPSFVLRLQGVVVCLSWCELCQQAYGLGGVRLRACARLGRSHRARGCRRAQGSRKPRLLTCSRDYRSDIGETRRLSGAQTRRIKKLKILQLLTCYHLRYYCNIRTLG